MKKIILGISLLLLLAFNVQTSFGYSVTFEDWGNIIKETPLVCILEPTYENDIHLTEDFVEKLMVTTQRSIGEWEVHLKTITKQLQNNYKTIKRIQTEIRTIGGKSKKIKNSFTLLTML